jgi:hypothetical protein
MTKVMAKIVEELDRPRSRADMLWDNEEQGAISLRVVTELAGI